MAKLPARQNGRHIHRPPVVYGDNARVKRTSPSPSPSPLALGPTARGERDKALRHLKAATDLNPIDVDARNDYALALFKVGAWQKAIDQIHIALKTNPQHLTALKNAVRGESQARMPPPPP